MQYILFIVILSLFSCTESNNKILVKNTGIVQGTFYHIQYLSEDGKNYINQIDSIFHEIDSSLSIYKGYSLISKINNQESVKTDVLFNEVYNASREIYIESEGYFDCSIYPLVKHWGFYEDFTSESLIIDSTRLTKILDYVGFDKVDLINDSLILPKGMRLDFNSIAQGYSVELIARFLQKQSVSNYLIEVGGEILAKGRNADQDIWRVGVDKPVENINHNRRFQFILDLEDKALATSGNYRNFYEKDGIKYAHTINPFTGFPANNRLLSVTVIHDNCMLADAYATACMAMGVKKSKKFALEHPEIEIYLVYFDVDGNWKTYISPNLQKRLIN